MEFVGKVHRRDGWFCLRACENMWLRDLCYITDTDKQTRHDSTQKTQALLTSLSAGWDTRVWNRLNRWCCFDSCCRIFMLILDSWLEYLIYIKVPWLYYVLWKWYNVFLSMYNVFFEGNWNTKYLVKNSVNRNILKYIYSYLLLNF